jgi:hypothetical protein
MGANRSNILLSMWWRVCTRPRLALRCPRRRFGMVIGPTWWSTTSKDRTIDAAWRSWSGRAFLGRPWDASRGPSLALSEWSAAWAPTATISTVQPRAGTERGHRDDRCADNQCYGLRDRDNGYDDDRYDDDYDHDGSGPAGARVGSNGSAGLGRLRTLVVLSEIVIWGVGCGGTGAASDGGGAQDGRGKAGRYECGTDPTLNWAIARARCQQRGGDLAVLSNASELLGALDACPGLFDDPSGPYCWVGLQKLSCQCDCTIPDRDCADGGAVACLCPNPTWIDGTRYSGYAGDFHPGGDCGFVRGSSFGSDACDSSACYVCEIPR